MGIRTYGNSSDDETIQESAEAREIVSKILDYGVSQKQILYIINDLALNLENQDHVRRLVNLIKDFREEMLIISTKSPLEV
jgi:hypothetical protein